MDAYLMNDNRPVPGFRDLYESQQRGVDHLYASDATQMVAPMGYGKTVVALTAIGELIVDGEINAALVIAPKRVAEQVWRQEAAKWKHTRNLKIVLVDGPPAARLAHLEEDADIYVIGTDHIPWLCTYLNTLPADHSLFHLLVFDELSRLKNPRGVWSKAMRKVAPRFRMRWGLTGTPRPNGLIDQFAPLAVISAGRVWGRSFDRWRQMNFYPEDYQQHTWLVRPDREHALESDIGRWTRTVDMSDMPDLPDIITRDHLIELPESARQVYREMEKKLVADLESGAIVAANMGVMTVKLSEIAQGFLYDDAKRAQGLHVEKLNLLRELVEKLNGDPVIVVYEFQQDLDRLRTVWPDLRWLGAGVKTATAQLTEEAWNDRQLPMLALHPAAAGHGLNLQYGGREMVWLGMTWSPELYAQTVSRLHRQGQRDHCYVHRILAKDTIDEAKVLRVEQRITEQEAFKRYLRRV